MHKLPVLILAFAFTTSTANAAFTETTFQEQHHTFTLSLAGQKYAAEFLVNLSRKELEQLTGKHLNIGERIAFSVLKITAKRRLKKQAESKGLMPWDFLPVFFWA
jgi:hypothetical protein